MRQIPGLMTLPYPQSTVTSLEILKITADKIPAHFASLTLQSHTPTR